MSRLSGQLAKKFAGFGVTPFGPLATVKVAYS